MTIRDQAKKTESEWDYAFLEDCFSRRIRPSDIDGIVERNGHFLVLEAKLPGGYVSEGQRIMLNELVRLPHRRHAGRPAFTVVVFWGKCPRKGGAGVQEMQVWGDDRGRQPATNDDLRAFCSMWNEMAGSNFDPNPGRAANDNGRRR